jgi:HD-GYP domain-containing protein (c-di-GMP phosphodiesterase class II)
VKPVQQQTRAKISKRKSIPESIFWVSLILGIIFLIVHTVFTVITSTDRSFLHMLIGVDYRDFLQRLIVLCFFVTFASHIQYTVKTRREEDVKLQQALDSLRKALGTTIQVMVSVIEMRDPYTAGHQKKSADIARAIATDMGLAKDKIEGIRMAGIIHDIGKLSVPVSILSKPTKLTEIEFSLIKEHARSGYDMLKDVESPWPLAEIIYQHHERMNGSGYPRSLKGDEILMESRILAVADVVESMASHRPYRPTLGLKVALEEITKNKGILYDNAVVDACLRLFQEKGYQIS